MPGNIPTTDGTVEGLITDFQSFESEFSTLKNLLDSEKCSKCQLDAFADRLETFLTEQLKNEVEDCRFYEAYADALYTLADVYYYLRNLAKDGSEEHKQITKRYQQFLEQARDYYTKALEHRPDADIKKRNELLLSRINCNYWIADIDPNNSSHLYEGIWDDFNTYLYNNKLSSEDLSTPDLFAIHTALYRLIQGRQAESFFGEKRLQYINNLLKKRVSPENGDDPHPADMRIFNIVASKSQPVTDKNNVANIQQINERLQPLPKRKKVCPAPTLSLVLGMTLFGSEEKSENKMKEPSHQETTDFLGEWISTLNSMN